jgi:hypothetical protein
VLEKELGKAWVPASERAVGWGLVREREWGQAWAEASGTVSARVWDWGRGSARARVMPRRPTTIPPSQGQLIHPK